MHTNEKAKPIIWITFLIDSFDLIFLNAISPKGPSIFFRFLVEIQVSVIPDFKDLKVCWYANVAKSLIGPLSRPFAPCGPSLQLAMWLWRVKTYVVTLCKMFKLYNISTWTYPCVQDKSICNYVATTASPGTVLVFSIINSRNFIHFTCLRVVSRDFLKTRFTKCG